MRAVVFTGAAEDAIFTTAFAKIGLACDAGTTLLLPRLAGYANALELCLTGDRFDARRADTLGLVTRLVPPDNALSAATEFARRFAEGPASLAYIKRELVRNALGDVRAALAFEAEMQSLAGKTDDFRAGLAAFTAKRQPVFRGR
ncbi:MAG: enoyl-CoA hydratase-related protein [Candidatus Lustribacter sp.]